jgi:hypothetical protein
MGFGVNQTLEHIALKLFDQLLRNASVSRRVAPPDDGVPNAVQKAAPLRAEACPRRQWVW